MQLGSARVTGAQPADGQTKTLRMSRPVIIIPARMQASRLPRKPLAEVGGEPMIVHVWRRAVAACAGDVFVATDAPEIAEAVRAAGAQAIMTRDDHASGSDRVHEAAATLKAAGEADIVVNLQGDLPTLDPSLVRECIAPLEDPEVDIATLAAEIDDPAEVIDPNVVKVIATSASGAGTMRALYFTRAPAPSGYGPFLHHIGIYAYRRAALDRFVSLPASPLEQRERLEQLRALEAGMRIDLRLVDSVPLGVDTPADLERARALHAAGQHHPERAAERTDNL
jgi:3-deoxy-manno-octulosonate cytidylyltransferase (CMP-KDO synthetase)